MKIVVTLSGVTDQRRALSNHSLGLSLVACFRRRATSHAPSQKTSTRPDGQAPHETKIKLSHNVRQSVLRSRNL